MDVLVVGAGAMGRWFGRTVDGPVTFTDAEPASAESAATDLDGRAIPLEADEAFDVVCIAVPMRLTESAIAAHAPRARKAMLDLSGVMAGPVAAMAEHAPDVERASLHPLFGPDNAPGRIAVVAEAPGPVVEEVRGVLVEAGNYLFDTTPVEHDAAMRTIQAQTHAALLAFALAAEEVPDAYGTPIYDRLRTLTDEFLSGTPRVYADIQTTFEGAEDVADAARHVADADGKAFERLYRSARE